MPTITRSAGTCVPSVHSTRVDAAVAEEALHLAFRQHVDAVARVLGLVEVAHLRRDDAVHHAVHHLDDRDVEAELAECRRALEADVAGADDRDAHAGLDSRADRLDVRHRAQHVHAGQVRARHRQRPRVAADREHELVVGEAAAVGELHLARARRRSRPRDCRASARSGCSRSTRRAGSAGARRRARRRGISWRAAGAGRAGWARRRPSRGGRRSRRGAGCRRPARRHGRPRRRRSCPACANTPGCAPLYTGAPLCGRECRWRQPAAGRERRTSGLCWASRALAATLVIEPPAGISPRGLDGRRHDGADGHLVGDRSAAIRRDRARAARHPAAARRGVAPRTSRRATATRRCS